MAAQSSARSVARYSPSFRAAAPGEADALTTVGRYLASTPSSSRRSRRLPKPLRFQSALCTIPDLATLRLDQPRLRRGSGSMIGGQRHTARPGNTAADRGAPGSTPAAAAWMHVSRRSTISSTALGDVMAVHASLMHSTLRCDALYAIHTQCVWRGADAGGMQRLGVDGETYWYSILDSLGFGRLR